MFFAFNFLFSNPASAFCGTYVGSAGADLFSHTSQVAIARQGDQTTLTLVNDYEGSLDDFALVIPVPSILTEDDVAVVEENVLSRVEAYSSPRLVEYSCEDFYTPWRPSEVSIGCFATAEYAVADMGDAELGESAESSVTIESSFSVGEYNLAVLSAEEGGELNEWLDTYGFSLGADASGVLQEYIDAGSYFLISRVKLNTSPEGQTWLRPLQISYTSEVFSLPIKLGTLNSPGEQDLIVYTVTDVYQGHIGIQNYPEISIQADCMLENTEDFASFYRDRLDDAFAGQDGGWLREHGWGAYHCDPCVDGDAMSDDDIRALGFAGSSFDAYVGRLHMRFTPEAATEDVVFYHSNIEDQTQQRYIRYVEELESRFLICDQESLDASKNCDALYEEWDAERKEVARGCFSTHMRSPIGLLLGCIFVSVFFMRNRRKSDEV